MKTDAFDYELPVELIAQHPVEPRDRSRLLVVRRNERRWEHRTFAALPELLQPGDALVLNNTRVLPARLLGHREATGGKWEGLFLLERPDHVWEILATTRGKPVEGERVVVGRGLILVLVEKCAGGRWIVRPLDERPAPILLEEHGVLPLPPYIRAGIEGPGDRRLYQTVFAAVPGAVAAPTAGLHFTEQLFQRLKAVGVERVEVTLHVGLGTFRPIETERIEDHRLHAEWAEVGSTAAETLNRCRARGGRIIAVGTTSARTLESAVDSSGRFQPFQRETALYLRPGHKFRGLDALITNFHLPKSSLLVLVAALLGVPFLKEVYAEAIHHRYRFYSYGDAMLIL